MNARLEMSQEFGVQREVHSIHPPAEGTVLDPVWTVELLSRPYVLVKPRNSIFLRRSMFEWFNLKDFKTLLLMLMWFCISLCWEMMWLWKRLVCLKYHWRKQLWQKTARKLALQTSAKEKSFKEISDLSPLIYLLQGLAKVDCFFVKLFIYRGDSNENSYIHWWPMD